MKYFYTFLLLLTCTFLSAQIVYIPDINFKNALIAEGVDTNGDGEIQISEAEAVINLNVSLWNISSLEGIQSFINIEKLYCDNNRLNALDVSQNIELVELHCYANEISNLDVTQNTQLKRLWCQINQLTDLDVSQNLNLEDLSCSSNQLTVLDLSENLNLERLDFSMNSLESVDITQNLNIEMLHCWNNQLNSLDLSQHTALVEVICFNNELTSLNIANGNNEILYTLVTENNPELACIQVDDENAARPICEEGLPIGGWCIDEWTSYSEYCSLAVMDWEKSNFSLYPNPVFDELILSTESVVSHLEVKVINMEGRLLDVRKYKSVNQVSLDVSYLSSGIYFLNIKTENGNREVKKFVKQ